MLLVKSILNDNLESDEIHWKLSIENHNGIIEFV
jgi:hypothetical protein